MRNPPNTTTCVGPELLVFQEQIPSVIVKRLVHHWEGQATDSRTEGVGRALFHRNPEASCMWPAPGSKGGVSTAQEHSQAGGSLSESPHSLGGRVWPWTSHNEPAEGEWSWVFVQEKGKFLNHNRRVWQDQSKSYINYVSVLAKLIQLCLTLCDPMDCSLPPGSSVHGISQSRILEWVAIAFSSDPGIEPRISCCSCIGRQILSCWTTGGALIQMVIASTIRGLHST